MRGTFLPAAALMLFVVPAAFPTSPPAISIQQCVVQAGKDKAETFDCRPKASAVCAGHASCELPIGKNLIADNWLPDGETAWVTVKFSCAGSRIVSRGPHELNDHASLVLRCPPPGGE
jgi:hypothetical protein